MRGERTATQVSVWVDLESYFYIRLAASSQSTLFIIVSMLTSKYDGREWKYLLVWIEIFLLFSINLYHHKALFSLSFSCSLVNKRGTITFAFPDNTVLSSTVHEVSQVTIFRRSSMLVIFTVAVTWSFKNTGFENLRFCVKYIQLGIDKPKIAENMLPVSMPWEICCLNLKKESKEHIKAINTDNVKLTNFQRKTSLCQLWSHSKTPASKPWGFVSNICNSVSTSQRSPSTRCPWACHGKYVSLAWI